MSKLDKIRMGKFTAIHMRRKVDEENALVINTCGRNDTDEKGHATSWVWSNPTNRAILHPYQDVTAVSVECLWQGTKMLAGMSRPKEGVLKGDWRKGKAKRPIGAWTGPGNPLITTPGEARRKIYLPAFQRLIEHWMQDPEVAEWVQKARDHEGWVYLRDHDTGRGVDQNGPMSHAWVLATFLNTGKWPKYSGSFK
jgi:hypothetical protein